MFSLLDPLYQEKIESLCEFREYAKADMIFDQNTVMDGMYIIQAGEIRLKQTADGKRVSLGLLGTDTSIGEMSLVRLSHWDFQAFATGQVSMIWVPAEAVRALAKANPSLGELVTKQAGLTELSHRLRGLFGSASYTPDQLNQLLEKVGLKTVLAGETFFTTGQTDPRLYYVERGTVDLKAQHVDGSEILLDTVRKGDLFGEAGALTDIGSLGVQPHTAVAITNTTALVIKIPEVEAILKINPTLHESLRERAKFLAWRIDSELASRKTAEGADQRVKLGDAVTEEEFRRLDSEKEPVAKTKFPILKQHAESENASACVAMIAQHYGKKFSVGQVQEMTSLTNANPTPNHIITSAERLGFNSKAYALDYDSVRRLTLPAIIGWENFHYVVLVELTATEACIADPDAGILRISRKEFIKSWTSAEVPGVSQDSKDRGVYIAFYPTKAFLSQYEPKKPYMHFVGYILPYKFYFFEAMIAALTINVLGMASPLFVQTIIDTVIVHKDVALLNVMLVGMVLCAMMTTLASSAQSMLLAFVTARIDLRLVAEFYRHVLSLPMNFFLTRNKGDIMSRFGENQKIRNIMAGQTITVILNLMMIGVYIMMMVAYSGTLTVIYLVFIPLYIGIILYFTPLLRANSNKIFLTSSQSQSQLIEALNGIEAIKATGNEYMARSRWEDSFVDNVNTEYDSAKIGLASNTLYSFCGLASSIAILWVGASSVIAGKLTVGELMGFQMLSGMVTGPIMGMIGLWSSIQEVRISVERVSDVLALKTEDAPADGSNAPRTVLKDVKGKIEFKDVNYGYMQNGVENLIMRQFNLTIDSGQRVAFVGPSGCGKSTIAKMVLGFNVPSGGLCTVDGVDITSLDISSLRKNIGVVLQDSFIFAGTVAENIAFGESNPSMEKVLEAAKAAGSHEFILNYPQGYQTLIGERGMGISGGQRQRICFARALYYKPRIMIFDEATSALDEESQAKIQENMRTVLAGKTSITIAHRLTTIIDSDVICYINKGQVLERGSHKELTDPAYLKAHGYTGKYYELAQPQFNLPRLVMESDPAEIPENVATV